MSAFLQVRHSRSCRLASSTSADKEVLRACTCKPTYRVSWWESGKLRREPAGRNRRQAEGMLAKLRSSLDEGELVPQGNKTFAVWADEWLAGLERPKANTIDSYRPTLAYAKSAFGEKVVRKLTVADVIAFLSKMQEAKVSASTQAKHLRVLNACLRSAVQHGYAAQNPIGRLDRSERPKVETKEAAWFEDDELPKLFAEIHEGLYKVLCLVALKTGMRQGELLAAQWDDLDLAGGVIHVRRNYTAGALSTPKTLAGRRDVHLTSDVVDLLGAWWGELGKPADVELVFPGEGQEYVQNFTILRRELYPAMKRAGVPREHAKTGQKRNFHSFRHTYARIALENGRSLPWLQKHLGHSTLAVTVGIYGHHSEAAAKREVAELEGVFGV